jgi:hypothetical protein
MKEVEALWPDYILSVSVKPEEKASCRGQRGIVERP